MSSLLRVRMLIWGAGEMQDAMNPTPAGIPSAEPAGISVMSNGAKLGLGNRYQRGPPPPNPPPGPRGWRARASFTVSVRPPISLPFRFEIAASASADVGISTNPKSARASRLAVSHDGYLLHFSVHLERLPQLILSGLVGKVSYVYPQFRLLLSDGQSCSARPLTAPAWRELCRALHARGNLTSWFWMRCVSD